MDNIKTAFHPNMDTQNEKNPFKLLSQPPTMETYYSYFLPPPPKKK